METPSWLEANAQRWPRANGTPASTTNWRRCVSPARDAVFEHNSLPPRQRGNLGPGLKALLGGVGEGARIEAPFHCAYGFNIFLGDGVFLNAGCTILDTATRAHRQGNAARPQCADLLRRAPQGSRRAAGRAGDRQAGRDRRQCLDRRQRHHPRRRQHRRGRHRRRRRGGDARRACQHHGGRQSGAAGQARLEPDQNEAACAMCSS